MRLYSPKSAGLVLDDSYERDPVAPLNFFYRLCELALL